MNANLNKVGNWAVVSLEGRMDTMSAPDFEQQIHGWISRGETRLVVDFTNLEYISSAGLRTILTAAKKAKAAGGKLSCCGLTGMVKQVFDISGFMAILPVFDSLQSAIEKE